MSRQQTKGAGVVVYELTKKSWCVKWGRAKRKNLLHSFFSFLRPCVE